MHRGTVPGSCPEPTWLGDCPVGVSCRGTFGGGASALEFTRRVEIARSSAVLWRGLRLACLRVLLEEGHVTRRLFIASASNHRLKAVRRLARVGAPGVVVAE